MGESSEPLPQYSVRPCQQVSGVRVASSHVLMPQYDMPDFPQSMGLPVQQRQGCCRCHGLHHAVHCTLPGEHPFEVKPVD